MSRTKSYNGIDSNPSMNDVSQIDQNKSMVQLADNMDFDRIFKEKAQIKHSEEAKKQYKFQKSIMRPIKNLSVLLYIFLIPYFETPKWCFSYYSQR